MDRLVSKRACEDRHPDPDELGPSYVASVGRYHERVREENRARWRAFHLLQAERIEKAAQALVAEHRRRSGELTENQRKEATRR